MSSLGKWIISLKSINFITTLLIYYILIIMMLYFHIWIHQILCYFYTFFLHVCVCLKPFLTSVTHYVILLFNITLLVPWNLLELALEHHTTCPQRSVRINPTTIKRELLAFGLKVLVKSYGFFLMVLCNFLFFTCEMRIAVTASDHFSVS